MVQDPAQRLQQQHEETIIREARIRLDLKKTFMDDEFFFPEIKPFVSTRLNSSLKGRDFASPANLRAVLKASHQLAPKTDNTNVSEAAGRFIGQQYYQNQLVNAVQQQHQQKQQQQQYNPYLNNSGFHSFGTQQDGYSMKEMRNW
ncbi:LANO_0C02608g1_1 [Lachancea nothofagi CBS 11611]|uniref:LANO_0C02608g1_1 n=1 Tax=Lachancea nothofagi CBS 11611 TaxID=1266666 RepID=A0A1G4J5Q5_9SACH|nr:LANO_0C02608g1_1 [Lachancea nothofagi CBS 11611]